MRRQKQILMALAATLLASSWPLAAQTKEFRNWPAGTSPQEIGKRVTERFLNTPHLLSHDNQPPYITYPESVTWYGALTFAQLSGDMELSSRLIQRFVPLLNQDAPLVPRPTHVDLTVFG